MTTKIYQKQLPIRNIRIITPVPLPAKPQPPDLENSSGLAGELKDRLARIFAEGFWYCYDCDCRCERIEGEQGQSARCERCGSHRIEWNPPLNFLQPEGA